VDRSYRLPHRTISNAMGPQRLEAAADSSTRNHKTLIQFIEGRELNDEEGA